MLGWIELSWVGLVLAAVQQKHRRQETKQITHREHNNVLAGAKIAPPVGDTK